MKNGKDTKIMLILWILSIVSIAINIIIFIMHNSYTVSEERQEISNYIKK